MPESRKPEHHKRDGIVTKASIYKGISTKAIHAGEWPDPDTGASAPNIVMSSTFVTDQPQGFSANELTPESPFVYSRWANPTVAQLEAKLAALEGGEQAVCFASGMAASSAIFFSLLSAGDHVIVADVCYAGVAELARTTLPRMGVAVSLVDMSNLEAVRAAVRPNTKLIYTETPANPIMRLSDLAALVEIAREAGAKTAVDSTFATPIATQPLTFGVDYVMHSLTKYICGHGDALGGAVIGSSAAMQALNAEATVHYGGVLSPFNAWLIMRGAATLPLRMQAHEKSAIAIARFLQSHPRITRVLYPGLESHPQYALAQAQMRNTSAMISFQVKDAATGHALAQRMARDLRIIHYAVSLGHHRSLIVWMPTDELMESSFALEGAALESYRALAGDGVFRLSVGLEDTQDLIADLKAVLGTD